MADDYRYIGKLVPRKDAIGKVTGLSRYTVDKRFPGMLTMRFLRSTKAHANILSIDVSEAMKIPGVLKVYTYEDVKEKYGYMPVEPGGYPTLCLLDSRVRYVGDLVAAILATDNTACEEAMSVIKVEYEELPAVFDVDSAIAPGAPIIHPELETQYDPTDPTHPLNPDYKVTDNYVPTYMTTEFNVGDVDAGFAEADIIVENTFVYDAHQPHICLEPHSGVAVPEGDTITVYLSTQSMWGAMSAYERVFGPNAVNIVVPPVGGAFGSKHDAQRENVLIAVAAKDFNRPVSNFPTREEEYYVYLHRCGMKSTWKLGAKKDGRIVAFDCKNYTNCGGYNFGVRCACAQACISSEMIDKVPNQRYQILPVFTNTPPGGAYRGYGFFEGAFALGSAVLKIAEKLGLDPLEVFKINGVQPGDTHIDYQVGHMKTVTSGDLPETMSAAAERFRWKDRWKGWGVPTSVDGSKRRGVGFGVCVTPRGGMGAAASVMLNGDGSVKISAAVTEIGQGTQSALCSMVAEEMHTSYEAVSFNEPNSAGTPYTAVGQAESRSLVDFGNAVLAAAADAKKQLFEIGAAALGVKPEEVDTADNIIYVKEHPEICIPWLFAFGFTSSCIIGQGNNTEHVNNLQYPHVVPFAFWELEVDCETGELHILDYLGGVDCGKIINPYALRAQYEGGSLQGEGFVLREREYMDKNTGKVLNGNMIFCGHGTILDQPDKMDLLFTENQPDPLTPFGAKGEGEGANSPAWGLILAFHNATGIWPEKFPLTPKEVLELLGKA